MSDAQGRSTVYLCVKRFAAVLLATTVLGPGCSRHVEAREAALRVQLNNLRQCLDQFYADKHRYPVSLQELVQERYIRRVPMDPISGTTTTWIEVVATPSAISGSGAQRQVTDIRSGPTGRSSTGQLFSTF